MSLLENVTKRILAEAKSKKLQELMKIVVKIERIKKKLGKRWENIRDYVSFTIKVRTKETGDTWYDLWDEAKDAWDVIENEKGKVFGLASLRKKVEQVEELIKNKEAPMDADLGMYFLGSRREIEDDTPKEDKFQWKLQSHFHGRTPLSKSMRTWLMDMKNQGWYKRFLKPPGGLVYRGIMVSFNKAAALGINTKQTTGNKKMKIEIPVKSFGSWSTNPSVAADFATGGISGGYGDYDKHLSDRPVLLILVARANKGFVLNPSEMADVGLDMGYENESEVIQADTITTDRVLWYVESDAETWFTKQFKK